MELDIKVSEEVLEAYQKVYAKDSAFIIFKSDSSKETVVLDQAGGKDSTFDDFKALFPDNEPR